MTRRRVVRVPASSANLGPGFDCFAAALSMHLELEVVESGSFSLSTDLAVAGGRENLCVRAFERLHPAERFAFTLRSSIPLCGGFGSSAAATLAGLMAADHLFELDADLFELAAEMEGHPDNVAAAMHGGFVVCTRSHVARFDAPSGLEALAVIPEGSPTPRSRRISTSVARAALPAQVPLPDAVFNVAHGALLVLGLRSGDFELIARGLHDRLHQDYRAKLFPRSHELMSSATRLGALGATISGAGPAVLMWCHYEQTGAVMEALRDATSGWAEVARVPFETQGAYVEEL
jgi:homoserine kinase